VQHLSDNGQYAQYLSDNGQYMSDNGQYLSDNGQYVRYMSDNGQYVQYLSDNSSSEHGTLMVGIRLIRQVLVANVAGFAHLCCLRTHARTLSGWVGGTVS